jgi:hypothetical protein
MDVKTNQISIKVNILITTSKGGFDANEVITQKEIDSNRGDT